LLCVWLLLVTVLADSGVLAGTDAAQRLVMPAAIFLPVVAFLLAYRYSPGLRTRVADLDTGVLVSLHAWRMLGAGFLLLYAFDVLPGLFAWLAGGGDMLVAAGALILGIRLLQGRQVKRTVLLRWNAFGMLDFLVAVGVGTALRSSNFGGTVSTDVMASLPLSLIPTFIVPVYLILHAMIFLQYRSGNHGA
jgi:hypothetical protein